MHKKGAHQDIYECLKENREILFTSKIPVVNPRLRPIMIQGDRAITDPLNERYIQLIKLAASLDVMGKDKTPMALNAFASAIQRVWLEADDLLVGAISDKKGFLRNSVMGSRANFSSRCVLTPLPMGTAIDEVWMPYTAGVELLKLQVVNWLVHEQGMKPVEALHHATQAAINFDPDVYDFICRLVGDNGLPILLNRNPTISIGSILKMRLTKVKDDVDDQTMGIRNNVLPFLAADYDGDVLNVFMLFEDSVAQAFNKLTPFALARSLDDGRFNRALSPGKDYALGLQTLIS
jgi:DNA-directed RNA polymerase beta' subunit